MKKVAVITRTKDRPVLLKRAFACISSQTYRDFIWVVVNDGGRREHVEEIGKKAKMEGVDIIVLHSESSCGMESASNNGIKSCKSDYIVIHDDDDSWAPDFLKKTIAFLEQDENLLYGGVITHSIRVNEVIKEDRCIFINEEEFNTHIKSLYLMEMARGNKFPPISFVFKRSVYDVIGGYDESLPVLGDWEFNLRFLLESDIGVIQEPLAYYHHRVTNNTKDDVYGNTIISGVDKHIKYDTLIRNKMLRNALKRGRTDLGVLVGLGRQLNDLFDELLKIEDGTVKGVMKNYKKKLAFWNKKGLR